MQKFIVSGLNVQLYGHSVHMYRKLFLILDSILGGGYIICFTKQS